MKEWLRIRLYRWLWPLGPLPICWRCRKLSQCSHDLHGYVPLGERKWVSVCGNCREVLRQLGTWDRVAR